MAKTFFRAPHPTSHLESPRGKPRTVGNRKSALLPRAKCALPCRVEHFRETFPKWRSVALAPIPPLTRRVSRRRSYNMYGISQVLTVANTVPEPSTLCMAAMAIGAGIALGRLRR